MNDETKYWVLLNSVSGVGPKTFRALVEHFGNPKAVLEAQTKELEARPRITSQMVEVMKNGIKSIAQVEENLLALQDEGVEVLTLADHEYPENLKLASDAPPVLYLRGRILPVDRRAVAVVGSREASREALDFARMLAAALVEAGVTVVSGLAPGIDGAAHAGALEAAGRTIAVLGSGIRVVFPPEHAEMALSIAETGAVVSELEPNTRASGPNLMARDRIISGLSLGVVVVQAGQDSGSMDTAQRAQKQNRPVFAVDWPGNAAETAGNRALLRGGAHPLAVESLVKVDSLLARLSAHEPKQSSDKKQLQLF